MLLTVAKNMAASITTKNAPWLRGLQNKSTTAISAKMKKTKDIALTAVGANEIKKGPGLNPVLFVFT